MEAPDLEVKKKGRGKGKKAGKEQLVTLRLEVPMYEWLDKEAQHKGTNISALLREGVTLLKADRAYRNQVIKQLREQGYTLAGKVTASC